MTEIPLSRHPDDTPVTVQTAHEAVHLTIHRCPVTLTPQEAAILSRALSDAAHAVGADHK